MDLPLRMRPPSTFKSTIREPPEETRIWKYLDLAKFLSLLRNRSLHLAPTTEFWDRFEGDIGRVQKRKLIDRYGEGQYQQVLEFLQALREHTFVTCWTENEFESDAMWKIFTGASYGVALQTTYGRLKSILPEPDEDLACISGKVNYVDFSKELLSLESYCIPYFYKRKSFEHEREVRVIIQDLAQVRQLERGGANGANERKSRSIQLTTAQLNRLVESLHLSPGAPSWFQNLVRDICSDYGLERAPIRSSLDEEPNDPSERRTP